MLLQEKFIFYLDPDDPKLGERDKGSMKTIAGIVLRELLIKQFTLKDHVNSNVITEVAAGSVYLLVDLVDLTVTAVPKDTVENWSNPPARVFGATTYLSSPLFKEPAGMSNARYVVLTHTYDSTTIEESYYIPESPGKRPQSLFDLRVYPLDGMATQTYSSGLKVEQSRVKRLSQFFVGKKNIHLTFEEYTCPAMEQLYRQRRAEISFRPRSEVLPSKSFRTEHFDARVHGPLCNEMLLLQRPSISMLGQVVRIGEDHLQIRNKKISIELILDMAKNLTSDQDYTIRVEGFPFTRTQVHEIYRWHSIAYPKKN